MQRALNNAALLQALHNDVLGNPDIFENIKSFIDCDTIANFCLVNSDWCEKVLHSTNNNELRIEVAKCLLLRVNEYLETIRGMFANVIQQDEWVNEPNETLFIELGSNYFAVSITVQNAATTFVQDHSRFKPLIRSIANAFATLFNIKVSGEKTDTDRDDETYLSFIVKFNQKVPREIRMLLPFARETDDDLISLSAVPNVEHALDTSLFSRLLEWSHLRRSRRLSKSRRSS